MSQARMRTILTVAGIAGSLLLAGCSDDLDDLRADIEKAKQRPGGRIQPLPEVKPVRQPRIPDGGQAFAVPAEPRGREPERAAAGLGSARASTSNSSRSTR